MVQRSMVPLRTDEERRSDVAYARSIAQELVRLGITFHTHALLSELEALSPVALRKCCEGPDEVPGLLSLLKEETQRGNDWYASRIVPLLGIVGTVVPELADFLRDLRQSYEPYIDEPPSYGQNGVERDAKLMVGLIDAALDACATQRRSKKTRKKR